MNHSTRFFLCSCLLAAALGPAGAHSAAEDDLLPVGEARLQVLLWPVYQSRLFAPGGSYDPDARPIRFEITYLRDISADDLVDRTRVEWDHLSLQHPQQEQWLTQLQNLWPDVQEGDTLSLVLDESSSRFYFNDNLLGEMPDAAFGPQFLAIWLSPGTSRPELREALLGNAGE